MCTDYSPEALDNAAFNVAENGVSAQVRLRLLDWTQAPEPGEAWPQLDGAYVTPATHHKTARLKEGELMRQLHFVAKERGSRKTH